MSDELTEIVTKRLEKIRNRVQDPECAHYDEKELWGEVLEWAAAGRDVQSAAKEALKTAEIDFPRWFA